MKHIITLFFLFSLFYNSVADEARIEATLVTNHGQIVLELFPNEAPITVANFLNYSQQGFYENTLFHRIIPDFMVQGGGFSADFAKKETADPIKNEASEHLLNVRGTVAMSRASEPDSATSQFFININNNTFLDHKAKTPTDWGYAVFGRVVAGMEVVDKIQSVPVGAVPPHFARHAPLTPVILEKVLLNETATRWLASPESVAIVSPKPDDLLERVAEMERQEKEDAKAAEAAQVTESVEPVKSLESVETTETTALAAPDAPTPPDLPEVHPTQN
jgi:cyclophilin family peptidyl-prolyl cis-trans isomerase